MRFSAGEKAKQPQPQPYAGERKKPPPKVTLLGNARANRAPQLQYSFSRPPQNCESARTQRILDASLRRAKTKARRPTPVAERLFRTTISRAMKPRFFRSQAAFRAWLEDHHATAPELSVGFYKAASGQGAAENARSRYSKKSKSAGHAVPAVS